MSFIGGIGGVNRPPHNPLNLPGLPGATGIGGTVDGGVGSFSNVLGGIINPTSGNFDLPVFQGITGHQGMSNFGNIPGFSEMEALLGGHSAPAFFEMEQGMIATAREGEMSTEQLLMFMMIMMMQTSMSSGGGGSGGGFGSDFGPIMQMLAGMLSNMTDSTNSFHPGNIQPNPISPLSSPVTGGHDFFVRRMVDTALSKIGYQERNADGTTGNGNFSKFGAWYGMDGQPWCAMFVSWAADQAGMLNSVVPRHASTNAGVRAYQEMGRFAMRDSGYLPREGDAIYFTNEHGVIGHVGIVVGFNPQTNRVYTIEGNTSNAVKVRHYDLNHPRIHGFGINGGTSFGRIPANSTSGIGSSIT